MAIAGASGLVGSNLAVYLTTAEHDVLRLVRRPAAGPDEVEWDPAAARLDPAALDGVDAVVNFSGENLGGLWTASRRQAILASRVQATGTLAGALAGMGDDKPGVFVSVSAVGAYGSRGGEAITEESPRGEDFLADVCAAWEGAAGPAADAGVRVAHPRFGLVMTPQGGALGPLLPLFKAGLGGRIGDGWQWWSWVAIDDALAAIEWILHDAELTGPVNITSPEPVTNGEFTDTLARVLRGRCLLRRAEGDRRARGRRHGPADAPREPAHAPAAPQGAGLPLPLSTAGGCPALPLRPGIDRHADARGPDGKDRACARSAADRDGVADVVAAIQLVDQEGGDVGPAEGPAARQAVAEPHADAADAARRLVREPRGPHDRPIELAAAHGHLHAPQVGDGVAARQRVAKAVEQLRAAGLASRRHGRRRQHHQPPHPVAVHRASHIEGDLRGR